MAANRNVVLRPTEGFADHPQANRVDLQIEGGRLGGLLLVAGQTGEAVGEGVGDAEVHVSARPLQWRQFDLQLLCKDRPQSAQFESTR